MRKQIPTTNTNPDLTNIDHVPSSGTHSGSNAMLYVEVTRSCQPVGYVRNRLQFHTVLRNQKVCLLMQVYAWMVLQLLIFGYWSVSFFPHTNQRKPNVKYEETRRVTRHQTSTPTPKRWPKIQCNDLELCNVEYVSSNAKSSHSGSMLDISEDNDALIKMIIKGSSPTMSHVSRTDRVALDWLFDRINLDPVIQIK